MSIPGEQMGAIFQCCDQHREVRESCIWVLKVGSMVREKSPGDTAKQNQESFLVYTLSRRRRPPPGNLFSPSPFPTLLKKIKMYLKKESFLVQSIIEIQHSTSQPSLSSPAFIKQAWPVRKLHTIIPDNICGFRPLELSMHLHLKKCAQVCGHSSTPSGFQHVQISYSMFCQLSAQFFA